jgi:hypothetical protein
MDPSLSRDIVIPILLDLHTQYIDRSLDSQRVFSFLDFIEGHSVSRASQLAPLLSQFDRSHIVYFLRFVCVESVMDRSGVFDSSREILEERLAICRLLVLLGGPDIEAYHDEIKLLVRRLMIQRRLREIEQSKIYVDVESLVRKVGSDLPEVYERYQALRRGLPPPADTADVELAMRKVQEGSIEEFVRLRLPQNEVSELFETLVGRLGDEYVSSPEHGLDKYLSVRIRHGTLAAHLRRGLEVAHLLTTREAGSPTYKRNEFWPPRLPDATPEVRDSVALRLSTFATEFDALVDEVKSWIQITKDGNGPGLFDFGLREPVLRVLSEYIGRGISFDEAIAFLVEHFGVVLDKNLERIRQRIQGEAKPRATSLLDSLAADIAEYDGAADTGELINAIRTATTELQVEFDRVTSWFERAKSTTEEPFTVKEAIEVGVDSVRVVSSKFDATVEVRAEEPLIFAGHYLAAFVDILFIVFENVVQHSGLAIPAASVLVTVEQPASEKHTVSIEVSNDIGGTFDVQTLQGRIDSIRSAIRDDQYMAEVVREGGTGFHKLQRILSHDLGAGSELDLRLVNHKFIVRFLIPFKYAEVA